MKIFGASLLGLAQASHFRAIGYTVIQGAPGEVVTSRTLTYRREMSGYTPECTAAHVAAQTVSTAMGDDETCSLLDPKDSKKDSKKSSNKGSKCNADFNKIPSTYVVTDIEDALGSSNNYCYGYRQESRIKPTGPYTITWDSCCWVTLTTDANDTITDQAYGFTATFFDVENNAPQVKVPPIWKILSGCPAQTIDLSPVDLDGDIVKCRWATEDEALGAYKGTRYNSLTLDQERVANSMI